MSFGTFGTFGSFVTFAHSDVERILESELQR